MNTVATCKTEKDKGVVGMTTLCERIVPVEGDCVRDTLEGA